MTRVRRNVAKVARDDDWPAVLVDYERAVGLMRAADPGPGRPVDPTGWRFLAAIHGRGTRDGRTDTSNPMWSTCQHGSWFFLPWHRMYLAAFERIVQHHLGDEDWSLPYWYSVDPDHPRRAVLPAAFRDTSRPENNLYTRHRSRRVNRGRPISGPVPFDELAAGLGGALAAGRYATADGITAFGGGQRSRPSFSGPEQGLLEGTPHGTVHVLVGGARGWMSSFFTAALDPIFWLHHANLDRLWQVWLDLGHRDPRRKRAWLDTSFEFPAPGGATVSWRVAEVLDTRALGYEYDDVDAPSTVAQALDVAPPREAPEVETSAREVVRLRRLATAPTEETELQAPPRVLGAVADVDISTTTPVELALTARSPSGTRTHLRLEGVVGAAREPAYGVFLDVPAGEDPGQHLELWVGSLSTFGVAEASVPSERHDGDGLTVTFDATAVREVLEGQGRWDDGRVTISFTPPAPAALADGADVDDGGDVDDGADVDGAEGEPVADADPELGGRQAAAAAAARATTEGLRARRVALISSLTG